METQSYNKLDSVFNDWSKFLAVQMKDKQFNSNGITTLSLVVGIAVIKFMMDRRFVLGGTFYIILYLIDKANAQIKIMDNIKEESAFERNYYLIKNILVYGLIAYIIYSNYSKYAGCSAKLIYLILLIAIVLTIMRMGCTYAQDSKNYDKYNMAGKLTMDICPATNTEEAKIISDSLNYFTESTLVILIAGIIMLMNEFT